MTLRRLPFTHAVLSTFPFQASFSRATFGRALADYKSQLRAALSSGGGPRSVLLACILFASLCTYLIGRILPYNLFALELRPMLDIAKLSRYNVTAQVVIVLTLAVLFGLYYLAWQLCRGLQPRRMWWVLILGTLAINLSMIWMYPVGAADFFDYIMRGRITAQHGGNPFYDKPSNYPQDPFLRYTAWRNLSSAYGPLWELLSAATSRVAGADMLANVLAFKIVGLLFYFGCMALIAASLHQRAPPQALQGVCLFALNPLVIYETAGNGHNDIVLAFFILLGVYGLTRKWFAFAAVAFTAGALVKFIPVLILPMVIVAGLRSYAGWKARIHYLGLTSLACAVLVGITFAPFWKSGDPLKASKLHTKMFTASLPATLQVQLETSLGKGKSQDWVWHAAALLTAAVVIAATGWTWASIPGPSASPRRKSRLAKRGAHVFRPPRGEGGEYWRAPTQAATFSLLFFLIFTCLWFQAWYTIWPLALAAVLPESKTGRIAVLLSYSASWKSIIFDFFLYRGGPLPTRLWLETWLGPATFGLTWLYCAYAVCKHLATRFHFFSSPKRKPKKEAGWGRGQIRPQAE